MEVIVFPDTEAAAIEWLTDDLIEYDRPCTVADKVPTTRPSEFVTVQRTGGPRRDLVTDSVQLTFDCYAAKASEAATLANLVRGLVNAWRGQSAGGVTVYRVQEFAGPVVMPDPLSKQARYRFTASLDVRGHPITGGIS